MLVPTGRITLTAISPTLPGCPSRTFHMPDAADKAAEWAELHNAEGNNIYWQVNDSSRMHSRVKADDINAARFVWADLDPKVRGGMTYDHARADLMTRMLQKLTETASVVVDSGNGLQALFRLADPADLSDPDIRQAYLTVNRLVAPTKRATKAVAGRW